MALSLLSESLEAQRVPPMSVGVNARERIHNDKVYNTLLERNKMDIALYEYEFGPMRYEL